MIDGSKAIESISASWESDQEVLRHWGHPEQSRIVAICREELEDQVADDDQLRMGRLISVWSCDADVLEEYGHPEEAEALRRCTDALRAGAEGEGAGSETAAEAATEEDPEAYFSRDYDRGDQRNGVDPESAVEEPEEEVAEETRNAWTA